MTYRIKFTNAYKKSYKRAKKRGLNLKLLDDVVEKLGQGHKLDAKYRDHELHGNCGRAFVSVIFSRIGCLYTSLKMTF